MLRFAPALAILILVGPVAAGLAGTLLPAFGYLPTLGGESFSLEPWRDLLATPGLGTSVLLSFAAGLVTAAISLGVTVAFIAAWSGTALFAWIRRMVSPLLSVPHAAAAFGLAFLIAPSGWLFRAAAPLAGLERPPDLLIVHDPAGLAMMAGLVVKEIPFLLLVSLAALPQTDATRMARVAGSFGYGRMTGFLKLVLPRLYPQIRLPVYAVIAYSSSVVDVALILGPTTPAPLAVDLVNWMGDPDLAMRFKASAGAVLQLLVTGGALLAWWLVETVIRLWAPRWLTGGGRGVSDGAYRAGSAAATIAAAAAVILGLAGLAVWSVARFWRFPDLLPSGYSQRTWAAQLPNASDAILNSVLVALLSSLLALAVCLACLEREARTGRGLDMRALTIIYLPLIVPQVAFLFGLQILFLRFDIGQSRMAVIAAHLVFVMPYVFLSLGDPWRAWNPRFGQLAASLGTSPAGIFWRIRLPMLLAPVLTAFAVGFAVSIGQYLPTLMIGGGRWPTVTTEAVALAAGGNRRVIGVYAILQTLLPVVGFMLALAIPAFLFRNRRLMQVTS